MYIGLQGRRAFYRNFPDIGGVYEPRGVCASLRFRPSRSRARFSGPDVLTNHHPNLLPQRVVIGGPDRQARPKYRPMACVFEYSEVINALWRFVFNIWGEIRRHGMSIFFIPPNHWLLFETEQKPPRVNTK